MVISGRPTTGRPKKGNYREGRNKQLCIRIDTTSLKKLERVASSLGMTKSDFILYMIDLEYGKMGG